MSDLRNDDDRHEMSQYFLSMAPQNDLRAIISMSDVASKLNEENQGFILSLTVSHPLAKKFPLSVSYLSHFLKWLMLKVEEDGYVLSEKLCLAYADLIQSKEKEICFRHYSLNSQVTITLEASQYLVSHSTTGLTVWEAAKWLADWSMENASLLKNKQILELGSGVGLTGIAVCRTCLIKRYIFSDNSPEVLNVLHKNISLNNQQFLSTKNCYNQLNQEITNSAKKCEDLSDHLAFQHYNCQISVVSLDWNTVTTKELNQIQADTLFAADVFYDPSQFDALVRLFHLFLTANKDRRAYIVCTERNFETLGILLRKIAEMRLFQREVNGPQKLNFIYSEKVPLHIYELSYCS